MTLEKKVRAIEKVLKYADNTTRKAQLASGTGCRTGCGACCLNPRIQATTLEFLPAAYELARQDMLDSYLMKLDSAADQTCVFYSPFAEGGFCSSYAHRGLICRLFGFSAKTNKYGEKSLLTCRIIKTDHEEVQLAKLLKSAPVMQDVYMKLFGVDPSAYSRYLPVNDAIREAIRIVGTYFYYSKKPA